MAKTGAHDPGGYELAVDEAAMQLRDDAFDVLDPARIAADQILTNPTRSSLSRRFRSTTSTATPVAPAVLAQDRQVAVIRAERRAP